ncbi:kinesin-like protein KIF12 isoform X2 [Anneissia japonica]|uniref:kinesin-like protein KIF12 isoform X2 n=1 Tax=Anneissia japonica TaxID=1529436 RepID=UPI0014258A76|nr:kinesin-like protein KIF12 isoform X2 [Anneissia japonica]
MVAMPAMEIRTSQEATNKGNFERRASGSSSISIHSTDSKSTLNSATSQLEDGDVEDGTNVHVVARVRPFNDVEKKRKDRNGVTFTGNNSITIDQVNGKSKKFTFNAVFQPDASQQEFMDKCGIKKMVDMAVDGYACTTFAYGQTGSGKTYTITGPVASVYQDSVASGLIQRSFAHLFDVIKQAPDNYTLTASYLEIYNEQVKDLLNPSGIDSLAVRWSKDRGFYVENLFMVECETLDDVLAVLEEGMSQRQIATHNINEHSSRSHTIMTLYIDSEMVDPDDDSLYISKHGRLAFVDLAGSEKVKELGSSNGELLTETTNINKSLLTLGNCISALGDTRKRCGHIPYRDSKLTKLLADSLGGNGVTLMIACISPSQYSCGESLSTLRYANRAKRIKNKPVVKMDPRERYILSLKREVKLLRTENQYLRSHVDFPGTARPGGRKNNAADKTLSAKSSSDTLRADSNNSNRELSAKTINGDQEMNNNQRATEGSISETGSVKSAVDSSLYEMLQQYMIENETLRTENSGLQSFKERSAREHEKLSRDNERLSRKLDSVGRAFTSSPYPGTVQGNSLHSSANTVHSYNSAFSSNSSLSSVQLELKVSPPATVPSTSKASPKNTTSPQNRLSSQNPLPQSPWRHGLSPPEAVPPNNQEVTRNGEMWTDESPWKQVSKSLPPVDNVKGVPNGYRTQQNTHSTTQQSYAAMHHSYPLPHNSSSHPQSNSDFSPQQPISKNQRFANSKKTYSPQTHQTFPPSSQAGSQQQHGQLRRQANLPQSENMHNPRTQHQVHQSNEHIPPGQQYMPPGHYQQMPPGNSQAPPGQQHMPAGYSNTPPDYNHSRGSEQDPNNRLPPGSGMGQADLDNQVTGQSRADIYIPSLPSTRDRMDVTAKFEANHNSNVKSNLHTIQEDRDKKNPGKKAPNRQIGGSKQSVGTGYKAKAKRNAWMKEKAASTDRRQETKAPAAGAKKAGLRKQVSLDDSRIDRIPPTPSATPPHVKYKPKSQVDMNVIMHSASLDLASGPSDSGSLKQLNVQLRQDLQDLDGEIEYLKYVNKSKPVTRDKLK